MATTTNTFFTVSTTLPIIGDNIKHIRSDRLILRQISFTDLEAYHSLRKQEQPMTLLGLGPDKDLDETRGQYEHTQSDLVRLSLGIFKKENQQEGELIGEVGVNIWISSRPSLYYVLKKEHWSKGYGTEFLKILMEFWWSLPREKKELEIHPDDLDFPFKSEVAETLTAHTATDNLRSQNLLKKVGFRRLASQRTL